MTRRDGVDLLLLAALWGGSFLFMRLGAAEFGPVALAFVRVAGATALLLPILLWQGHGAAVRQHLAPIATIGIVNSALPFLLYAVAALALTTAVLAVFNATAPIWGALLAWLWLREPLSPARWLGLGIGVVGVAGLSWGQADLRPGVHGVSPLWAMAACVAATALYGLGANISRRYLRSVPPLAVAAGSQLAATSVLLVPALLYWPARNPGLTAWAAALALSLLCTGLAYILFFRLIARTNAPTAMSVTFLIPVFAMLWGALLLHERPTPDMLVACGIILLGTALSSGLLPPAKRTPDPG